MLSNKQRLLISREEQKGFVVVVVALLLVPLMAFAMLAVDFGVWYSSRTAAQKSADAAALAGAFTFTVSPLADQPTTAYSHAMAVAQSNQVLTRFVDPSDVEINVDLVNRRVAVDIRFQEQTYFARVLGFESVDIAVRGIAESSENAVGAYCTKPWFVPNTIFSSKDPCEACQADEVLIGLDGNVTGYAIGEILGTQAFIVKPQKPDGALAPGQFYCVRLGYATGGSDYRTNIAECSEDVISCQEVLSVEPGNMIGPTIQGVRDLVGDDPDEFLGLYRYGHEGFIKDTSRSLIVTPVWDTCQLLGTSFCDTGKLSETGATFQVPVIGYAVLFVEGVRAGGVQVRLISVYSCGGLPANGIGGGTLADEVSGPLSVPVQLVHLERPGIGEN